MADASNPTYTTPRKRTRHASKVLTRSESAKQSTRTPPVIENTNTRITRSVSRRASSIQADGNQVVGSRAAHVVTPIDECVENFSSNDSLAREESEVSRRPPKARRVLRMDDAVTPVTPNCSHRTTPSSINIDNNQRHPIGHTPNAKRKLLFGRHAVKIHVPNNVESVYNIVKKHTGGLGGNSVGGAIYGELTKGSMQKMVNLMKQHANLNADSLFLDVGSGIGKPNLHVAQDPGVKSSIGIEMVNDRYLLAVTCLKAVLEASIEQQQGASLESFATSPDKIGHNCFFLNANIVDATTLDPFTHVYMFSIGFPPQLWRHLSTIFNCSSTPYLICFHSPREIVQKYQFDVELIAQTPTSMHGSKEGHMGYIYKRSTAPADQPRPHRAGHDIFKTPLELVQGGLGPVKEAVDQELQQRLSSQAVTRSQAKRTIDHTP